MKISSPIDTGEFFYRGIKLGHSSFNVAWMEELGIPDPKVIFDVGGYDAGDAIRFKSIFNAVVYCFEPDPVRALKISGLPFTGSFIEFFPYAISDKNEAIPFYRSKCLLKDAGDLHSPGDYAGQGSAYRHTETYKRLYPHIEQEEQPIWVQSYTIEEICYLEQKFEIDLLHVDVEGSEYKVIKGLGDIRPKVIYMETLRDAFENAPGIEDLHELMISLGYELVQDFISDRLYIYKIKNQNG